MAKRYLITARKKLDETRRRFRGAAGGGMALSLAVASPALLAGVGVAVDFATWSHLKSRLQGIADTAAVSGAKELSMAQAKSSQIVSVVGQYVASHADARYGAVMDSTTVDLKTSEVKVALEQAWTPIFAHFIDAGMTPIRAESTAKLLTSTTKLCVLTLDSKAASSIRLDKEAMMRANGCAVYANSTNSDAIWLDDNSRITASTVCAAGGVHATKAGAIAPEAVTDCPTIPDPLADRAPPPVGACTYTFKVIVEAATEHLKPGTYCGGLYIAKDANVVFDEGIYVIKDGPLAVLGGAGITGKHVGFYFSGPFAWFECWGDAEIRLSGPTSGSMAGILLFEDRAAPLNRPHNLNCSNAAELTGTIYLSRGKLRVDPNGEVAKESAFTAIIANRLELDEGPDMVLNSDYDATDVPVPAGLKGSGTVVLVD